MSGQGAQGEVNTAESATDQGSLLALLAAPGVALSVIPMPRIGADPPSEFRPFVYGENPTTKGMLTLTIEGARQAVKDFKARGVAKCFDLWHSTYKPLEVRPQDRFAVGHFQLEAREDGLYFTEIQWVPQYADEIRQGKWPFISPAVDHTKAGVITGFRNAALVTDPGTIGTIPTILSADSAQHTPPKDTPMADSKRMVCDAYAALEGAMRKCQALADTDGSDKDLGNQLTGHMAPVMDLARGHMQGAGYLNDGMLASKAAQAGDKMLAQLSADVGESDPEKMRAVILARLDGAKPQDLPEGSVLLSGADAAAVSKLLIAGHGNRIPTVKRPAVEAMGLTGQVAYLSVAPEITPSSSAREAPPPAPTAENTQAALKNAPPVKTGASMASKTLATLSADEKTKLAGYLDTARAMQSAGFDEERETQAFLSLLSDYQPPQGDMIRHLPVGDDGRVTTLLEGSR